MNGWNFNITNFCADIGGRFFGEEVKTHSKLPCHQALHLQSSFQALLHQCFVECSDLLVFLCPLDISY
ncbi:MAG: hypothetical protein ABSG91_18710 [Syntrophobacteraceae bacterium]